TGLRAVRFAERLRALHGLFTAVRKSREGRPHEWRTAYRDPSDPVPTAGNTSVMSEGTMQRRAQRDQRDQRTRRLSRVLVCAAAVPVMLVAGCSSDSGSGEGKDK